MSYAFALRKDMYERKDTTTMVETELSKDGMLLAKVKHQTPQICWVAVTQTWRALQFVHEMNSSLVRLAVLHNAEAGTLIPAEFHLDAVIANINTFPFLRRPSQEACFYALKERPDWIAKLKNPSLEMCRLVIKERHQRAVDLWKNTLPHDSTLLGRDYFAGMPVTKELLQESLKVTKAWSILCTPQEARETLALEAVRINRKMLEYLPQTPELCWKACELSVYNIEHVHQPTEELVRMVCAKDSTLLRFAVGAPRDLVWECAKRWEHALKYAVEQDEELCVHAVHHFHSAIQHVRKNRFAVWRKAGLQPAPLTKIFPEFAWAIQRDIVAHNLFDAIRRAPRYTPKDGEPLEDPVTLQEVEKGTHIAFLTNTKGNLHFAGTADTLLDLMRTGFRGSNYAHIFVPIKNALVPTEQIRWRVAA